MVELGEKGVHIGAQLIQNSGQRHQDSHVAKGGHGGVADEEVAGQGQGHAPQPQGEGRQGVQPQGAEGVEDAAAHAHPVHGLGLLRRGQAQEDQAGQGVDGHQDQVQQGHHQQGGRPPGQVDAAAAHPEGDLVFQGVELILVGEDHVHPDDHQIDAHHHAKQQGGHGEGHGDDGLAPSLGFDQVQAEDHAPGEQGAQEGAHLEVEPVEHLIALGVNGAEHQNPSFPAKPSWWAPMRERK